MPTDNQFDPAKDQAEKQSRDEGINDKNLGKKPDSLPDGSGTNTKRSDSDQGQEDGEESFSAG